ncbi:bifunctional DNA primase/polymerase [Streptomyces sp. CBMA152]|uniref:bifunctional DNA primase/polymerase n=1 Tax=Streptomyces sp. CBMA152 TaxID=1896312 RepID=UPI001660753E|nr:bifunctional DNA primase/polymerase [Streptomyces sp. CBMA152]
MARWCASRGWPVHPLSPGRKTPVANCADCRLPGHRREGCACLDAGRWCHGFHAATVDPERIGTWWGAHPGLGVGVACGPAGLVVVDVDDHDQPPPARDLLLPGIPIHPDVDLRGLSNGFHTLAVLAALRGHPSPADDASTLRVRTPSGGLHVWYRAAEDGRRWHSSVGSGGGSSLAWQVDVRAHGGYIVAPGTVTPAGTYTPLEGAKEPAVLPSWLAGELERTGHLRDAQEAAQRLVRPMAPSRARQAVIAAGGGRDQATRVLASALAEVADCASVPEGAGFTDKLNRAAYTVGGLVAAGYLTEEAAERGLMEAAEFARPGQDRRSAAVVRSGMAAGSRRPLQLRSRP